MTSGRYLDGEKSVEARVDRPTDYLLGGSPVLHVRPK